MVVRPVHLHLGSGTSSGTGDAVAGVASEHDLLFLVISAGTRNHFAMDRVMTMISEGNANHEN
jgi:hypothetical protein